MTALTAWRRLSPMERYEALGVLEVEADLNADEERHATAKVLRLAAKVLRAVAKKGRTK